MNEIKLSVQQQNKVSQFQQRMGQLAAQIHLLEGQQEAYKTGMEALLGVVAECAGAAPADRYRLSADGANLEKVEG